LIIVVVKIPLLIQRRPDIFTGLLASPMFPVLRILSQRDEFELGLIEIDHRSQIQAAG
jgi:hypothetical protein